MLTRKLRIQRGWTQDQLAEMAGVNVRTIQRLERGHPPSLETAKALASVFEVDLSSIRPIHTESTAMTEPMPNVSITPDEESALLYAKAVKEFYQGMVVYAVIAVIFFAIFGFRVPVVYLAFAGAGVAVIIQGLIAFEVIRLPFLNIEKKLAERKLGRPL
jgi:XRE family transcriptional regulator, regulator of sulfur utilization